MKILITGINGLLGSYLAKTFAPIAEIHGLVRENSNLKLLGAMADKITLHKGDVMDYASLEAAFEDKDLIIHAAGLVSFEDRDKDKLFKINVEGTANVVNAMLDLGIQKLIHVSSVAALGRSPEAKVIDENHKWSDSQLNTAYAESKYLGELEVWRGVQEGLQAIVVNPSVLLGKISDNRSSTSIYQYVLEEKSYYPKGSINYLDVRDAAQLIYQLFEQQVWGERYILSKESISYQRFFEKMAGKFGKKVPNKKVTPTLLEIALWAGKIGKILGLTSSPINRQTAMLSQLNVHMANEKIQQLLDFSYTSLEDTLQWAQTNEN